MSTTDPSTFQEMLEVIGENYKNICEKCDEASDSYYLKNEYLKEALPKIQENIKRLKLLKEKLSDIRESDNNILSNFITSISRNPKVEEQYKKLLVSQQRMEECKQKYLVKEIEQNILELLTFKNYDLITKKIQENEKFLKETPEFKENLMEKFVKNCSTLLEGIQFPFDEEIDITVHSSSIEEMESNFKLINILSDKKELEESKIIIIIFDKIRERFNLHFNTKVITNDSSKPELLLTALNNWYSSNIIIIKKLLLSIYKGSDNLIDKVYKEFLISLGIKKIKYWLKYDDIINDPEKFGKLLDTIIMAITEYDGLYSINEDSTKKLLSTFYEEEGILEKWLCMEKVNFKIVANKYLDKLSNDEIEKERDEFDNDASTILYVIQSSVQRYELISDYNVKKQFLSQLIENVYKFKNRLLNIEENEVNCVSRVCINIANIVIKIHTTLKEMEIYIFNNNEEIFTININIDDKDLTYDDVVYDLKEIWLRLVDVQCCELLRTLDKYFITYIDERWHGMGRKNDHIIDNNTLEITESFLPYIYQLKNLYFRMEKMYPSRWLEIIIDKMNYKLFTKFINEFIMKKNFNEYGGKQLLHDIKNGLIVMLSDIFLNNENFGSFKDNILCNSQYIKLLDYINLLSLHPAVGVLLKESARDNPDEILIPKLEEFNFTGIVGREEILMVLNRKCDLLS
uniref:Exocyst complex component Sec6 n=1 Tax=Parastrongyloides trichosuri TaxID=131310 RepID=A0A0N4Z467_PARTI